MTLILDNVKKNNCTAILKTLIPKGSVVNSYAFYDGKMEIALANEGRFVNANTISHPVYVFWMYASLYPRRLYEMVSSEAFKFEGEGVHGVLQDVWHSHDSPLIKAALFFVLNRCSTTGLISSGELNFDNLTPVVVSKLKYFSMPENFHLGHDHRDVVDMIAGADKKEYNLVPAGNFNYNLFEYGKNIAIEETPIIHRELIKLCKNKEANVIITYNYDPRVLSAFKGNRIIMVDKYGKQTERKERAEEIVVANF